MGRLRHMESIEPRRRKIHLATEKPNIQCRLDFFLTRQSLISKINTSDIVPGYKMDHSMITMAIVTNSNPKGLGFWKLNTSFLSEDNYVTKIKNTIQETKN